VKRKGRKQALAFGAAVTTVRARPSLAICVAPSKRVMVTRSVAPLLSQTTAGEKNSTITGPPSNGSAPGEINAVAVDSDVSVMFTDAVICVYPISYPGG
jgi:hypothetical protein